MKKNKVKIFILVLLLIVLIFGIYALIFVLNKNSKNNVTKNEIKIDNEKDYIYTDTEVLVDKDPNTNGIEFSNFTINLNTKSAKETQKEINNKMEELKQNRTYPSDDSICTIFINDEKKDVVSLYFNQYKIYETKNYISLLIFYYDYHACGDIMLRGIDSYIFDLESGELVDNNDLKEKYDITLDEAINKLNDNLISDSTFLTIIHKENIIKNIKDNNGFYINNDNELVFYSFFAPLMGFKKEIIIN